MRSSLPYLVRIRCEKTCIRSSCTWRCSCACRQVWRTAPLAVHTCTCQSHGFLKNSVKTYQNSTLLYVLTKQHIETKKHILISWFYRTQLGTYVCTQAFYYDISFPRWGHFFNRIIAPRGKVRAYVQEKFPPSQRWAFPGALKFKKFDCESSFQFWLKTTKNYINFRFSMYLCSACKYKSDLIDEATLQTAVLQ
jgi:hypothetical protein